MFDTVPLPILYPTFMHLLSMKLEHIIIYAYTFKWLQENTIMLHDIGTVYSTH